MRNFSISKLAEIILAQRKALNLTQQELADKAGINRSMLCRLENQDYVLEELDFYIQSLSAYRDALAARDSDRLIDLLEAGKRRKEEVDG